MGGPVAAPNTCQTRPVGLALRHGRRRGRVLVDRDVGRRGGVAAVEPRRCGRLGVGRGTSAGTSTSLRARLALPVRLHHAAGRPRGDREREAESQHGRAAHREPGGDQREPAVGREHLHVERYQPGHLRLHVDGDLVHTGLERGDDGGAIAELELLAREHDARRRRGTTTRSRGAAGSAPRSR